MNRRRCNPPKNKKAQALFLLNFSIVLPRDRILITSGDRTADTGIAVPLLCCQPSHLIITNWIYEIWIFMFFLFLRIFVHFGKLFSHGFTHKTKKGLATAMTNPLIWLIIYWCRGTESNCRHGDFQTKFLEIQKLCNYKQLILFHFFN